MVGWIILFLAVFTIIFVHELAHAFTGFALGLRVKSLFVGFPIIYRTRIKGLILAFGPILLIGGTVIADLDNCQWWKKALVAFSGPLVNIGGGVFLYLFFASLPNSINLDQGCNETSWGAFARISEESLRFGGISGVLGIVVFLSIIVGVINLLPVPLLDGGRMALAFLEGILGQWILRYEEIINMIGLTLIIVLSLYAILDDVWIFTSSIPSSPNYHPCPD
jgi:membrane-associated protease RseP (regulator of RpoE activity)